MNYCRYCGKVSNLRDVSYTYQTESCAYCGKVLRHLDVKKVENGYLINPKT